MIKRTDDHYLQPNWAKRSFIRNANKLISEKYGIEQGGRPSVHQREIDSVLSRREQDHETAKVELAEEQKQHQEDFNRKVANGDVKIGEEASPEIQQMANELWSNIPEDYKNTSDVPQITLGYLPNNRIASVCNLDAKPYIHLGGKFLRINNAIGRRQEAALAHEIAHILNGDNTLESAMKDSKKLDDESQELLADRLGAIIYGNPALFRFRIEYIINKFNEVGSIEQMSDGSQAPDRNNPPRDRRLRHLKRWAEMLKERGFANDNCDITDVKGAIALYEKSKDFTKTWAAIDGEAELSKHR